MRISKPLVKYLLSYVTVGFFDDHTEPTGDWSEFDTAADSLLAYAQRTDNLTWLKLAMQHLLSDPEVDLEAYNGGQYPFTAEEMRDLLGHVWSRFWPDEEPPEMGEGPLVEIASMSNEEWAEEKAAAQAG